MLLNFIDPRETPRLNRTERMLQVLFSLKFATKDMLQTVTGWTEMQVDGAIKRIRAKGKTKQEKDEWLKFYRIESGEYVYELGKKAENYVRLQRNEMPRMPRTRETNGQIHHTLGVNQILCRLLKNNVIVDEWLGGSETAQYLFYQLARYEYKNGKMNIIYPTKPTKKKNRMSETPYLPIRPDAFLRLGEYKFFIEYDTGSESMVKLHDKLNRYIKLQSELGEQISVVFVTISDKRKQKIEEIAQETLKKYKDQVTTPEDQVTTPTAYCFVEGEDTKFLSGQIEAEPFWD